MNSIDWFILLIYLILIIGMGWWIGRKQKNRDDYYLGGRRIKSWQVAFSVMATQVSAISLIGAPAFVAIKPGGGMKWLQYEFAIPLAMIGIGVLLVPVFFRKRAVTIYAFLEESFGTSVRTFIALVFLLSRSLGGGVALLATGIVSAACLNLPLFETILIIGMVSILYTTFGGIKADIYSDIMQLGLLWMASVVMIFLLWGQIPSQEAWFANTDILRLQVFQMRATGIGSDDSFGFWPMLIGGLFLYISYYGCDQSQAQRLLTTQSISDTRKALFINGFGRFFIVVTYMTVGILFIPYLKYDSQLLSQVQNSRADFLVPYFILKHVPHGLIGLIVAGIFAASMSSIDSILNSLSASTLNDIFPRIKKLKKHIDTQDDIRLSRSLTVFWGIISTGFALFMINGSETVLELVNKIGSAFYGPVLALFLLGILFKGISSRAALSGTVAGVTVNMLLWLFAGDFISWMWWNVTGFLITIGVSLMFSASIHLKSSQENQDIFGNRRNASYIWKLTGVLGLILFLSLLIHETLIKLVG